MLEDIDCLITHDKKAFLENEKLMATPWGNKVKRPKDFLALLK
jgi:hypothetical protein